MVVVRSRLSYISDCEKGDEMKGSSFTKYIDCACIIGHTQGG